jgi:catechol 2,3-dioxygenase-like lactoylglutathione lyase family enzyme
MNITSVATVAVPISDQGKSVTFYTETLGFEVRMDDVFGPGMRWIEVAPPGAATSIALPPPGPTAVPGVDTGIRLTTANAEADHATLVAAGVDVDPEILRWPGVPPMFSFRDPDANVLYIVEQG